MLFAWATSSIMYSCIQQHQVIFKHKAYQMVFIRIALISKALLYSFKLIWKTEHHSFDQRPIHFFIFHSESYHYENIYYEKQT